LIGGHTIYKIDDTDIIPIATDQDFARMNNPDEAKYAFSINKYNVNIFVYKFFLSVLTFERTEKLQKNQRNLF